MLGSSKIIGDGSDIHPRIIHQFSKKSQDNMREVDRKLQMQSCEEKTLVWVVLDSDGKNSSHINLIIHRILLSSNESNVRF